uniref:Adherens junctions associated protein 1 n=1 Tax=Anas zonorhyncha TaxID=75864 RepID=A0A8B9W0B0_9AVES
MAAQCWGWKDVHPWLLSLLQLCLLSGCPLGSHAWMLIAMFHLAMDLASCEPVGVRLSPRPAHRHRLPRGALWGMGGTEEPRRPVPPWPCAPRSRRPPPVPLPRARRQLSPAPTPGGEVPRGSPGRPSTAEPAAGHSSGGKDARPPRGLGDTSGLAVHQIITITVSLIMVIAALITTLVLKNCCAQSGTTRRNSHQRKINQQEESCQNLTDFTPARVPSSLDIFTAYNETLQCSHECVRTPVPVYTEEALHSPGDYKATYNGNRPSSSDRHLIPVAFVSEKWFEISC